MSLRDRRVGRPRLASLPARKCAMASRLMASSSSTRRWDSAVRWSNRLRVERENYNDMKHVIEGSGVAALPNTRHLRGAKRVVGLN